MKSITLHNGNQLLVDDEDYEEVSRYDWRCYRGNKNRVDGSEGAMTIKAYVKGGGGYESYCVFLSRILLQRNKQATWIVEFKDGNELNWQRDNLIVYANRRSRSIISAHRAIDAPWCPFGPAKIYKDEGRRNGKCLECSDLFEGPYYKCLALASRTFWPNWVRKEIEDVS
jgi:hypothetical protein